MKKKVFPPDRAFRAIIILFVVYWPMAAQAQQDPLYAQYLFNPLVINPAYAGLNNTFNATVGYRTQWMGIDGQPETFNVSAHTSILDNRAGAGLLIVNDRIGSFSTTEANASFAYKLKFETSTFSFGMQAGVQGFNTNNNLQVFDATDNLFQSGDRGTRMNIGAGVILSSETFLLGLSVPRLLPSQYKVGSQTYELYNQHFYLMGAYVHYLNERIRIRPGVLIRGVQNAPASIDINLNVNINAIHTAGIFTRNFGTYGVLLQTMFKEHYRFGYVFELPTEQSIGSQFTTHEVMLGIRIAALSFHDQSLSNF
jgi:type IX secretion system PorP/SprF family membrane protein